MKERTRIALLIAVMTAVVLVVVGISIATLYKTAIQGQRERLTDIVKSQARLMESVARFDAVHSPDYPGGSREATLSQLMDAHVHYVPSVPTQEIVIARREGDTMVFLFRTDPDRTHGTETLSFDTELAEPMRRALEGLSGTMIGIDYRGAEVLAAYEPAPQLGLGVVAKIDLAEIRAPFVRAGMTAGAAALFLVLVGAFFFVRVSTPILRRIEESEERLHLAYDAAKAGAWEWDLRTNKNVWSGDLWKLYGLKPHSEEPTYELWRRAIHPEDRPAAEAAVRNAAKSGSELNAEWRVNNPDAPERWLMSRGKPQRDESGRVARYLGIVIDITERKRAEEALRESEHKYRETVKYLDEGCYSCTMDGVLLEHNLAFNRILGYDGDRDLKGTRLPDFWQNPGDRKEYLNELASKGFVRNYPINAKTVGGQMIVTMANAHLIRDEAQRPVRIEGTFSDITDYRRAEKALHVSETKYRRLFEAAKDGILILNANTGSIIDANPYLLSMLGYSHEELFGKKLWEIGLFKDIVANRDTFRQLRDKEYVRYEGLPLQTKGGGSFIVEFVSNVYLVDRTKVIQCDIRDITDRKRAEETIRKSALFLDSMINQSPVPMWISDDKGTLLRINDACCDLLHIQKEEVIGKYNVLNDSIVLEQGLMQEVQAVFEEGKTARFDLAYDTTRVKGLDLEGKASVNLDVTIFPVRDPSGTITNAVIQHKDITDRKRAEEALRALSSRQEAILGAVTDIIMEVDSNKVYTWANRAGFEFFGEDVIGKEAAAYFVGEQDTYVKVEPLFAGDESLFYVESWQRRRDGEVRLLGWWCRVLKADEGNVMGALSSARDITEFKRAEEEVLALNRELEQRVRERTASLEASNAELEAFSYSVSHDLRAPLRAVDGFAGILLEEHGKTLDDEGKRVCAVIRANTHQMGRLIDDLLAFSRLGRAEMEPSPIDMATLADSIYHEVTTAEDRARIDFRVGPLPEALGDPTLMRQVWTNLLSNAVKFSSKRERAVIEVGLEPGDGETVYSIRDNGAGFDMRYVDKLFGVFQRLHSASEFPGTGVGLAIVQRIIHRHGGRVRAEGEVDRGAAFHFSLPNKGDIS